MGGGQGDFWRYGKNFLGSAGMPFMNLKTASKNLQQVSLFHTTNQAIEDWICDKYIKALANKLVITKRNFGLIISFTYAKQLLEQIQSLVTCL